MYRIIYLSPLIEEANYPNVLCPNSIEKDGKYLYDALHTDYTQFDNIIGVWRENGVPVIELDEETYLEYLSPVIEYDENGDVVSETPRGVEEVHSWGLATPAWAIADMTPEQTEWLNNYIDSGIAEYRDSLLIVNVTTNLSGGRTVILKNDDRTKTAISSKKNTISNETSITTMAFEARNGWFDFSYNDYQDLEVSLDLFTQQIFDATREINSNHISNPYLTVESAKADMDLLLGGS